jgi:hypothetical protein
MSILKRGKVAEVKREVVKLLVGMTTSIEITSAADLDKAELVKTLIRSGGAHKPTHYEFAPGVKVDAGFYVAK